MKKGLLFLFIPIFLVSCNRYDILHNSPMNNIPANTQSTEDMTLGDFLIGKWEGEYQDVVNDQDVTMKFLVVFKNESQLEYCLQSPNDTSCDAFDYEQISDQDFRVENERLKGSLWNIYREDENLMICRSNASCVEMIRIKDK